MAQPFQLGEMLLHLDTVRQHLMDFDRIRTKTRTVALSPLMLLTQPRVHQIDTTEPGGHSTGHSRHDRGTPFLRILVIFPQPTPACGIHTEPNTSLPYSLLWYGASKPLTLPDPAQMLLLLEALPDSARCRGALAP